MPRYMIERTFPDKLQLTADADGARSCRQVVSNNADDLVTWIHSYVSPDKTRTFCVYEGPSPEAVRHAARSNNLPIDRITEVLLLDPYFYT